MAVCQVLLSLAFLIGSAVAQNVCPMDWELFEQQCYKFVMYPKKDFNGSLTDCARQHAALVSVNSYAENSFIKQKIVSLEVWKGDWYTSGEMRKDGRFRWAGDGTYVDMSPSSGYWVDEFAPGDVTAGRYLVYSYKGLDYGLKRSRPEPVINYICEIPLVEVYKVLQDERALDYGMDIAPTLSDIDSGPKFLLDSKNTVIVGEPKQAHIECEAIGKPPPTYIWKNGTTASVVVTGGRELSSGVSERYMLTNGRLTFSNPDRGLDTGWYQCQANNKYGTILSNPIQVSFGRLGEFPNVGQDAVQAYAHNGAQIECPKITAEPAIRYQWAKDSPIAFVRPLYSKYIFISSNSKLYFSEVTDQDKGYYYCVVSLTRPANTQSYIGSLLLPSATAIKIMLVVQQNAGGQNKPEILDDFIYVSPKNPKRGDTVSLECFAYGTPPLEYSWVRLGRRPMPVKSRLSDHGRVLRIEAVTEDDAGSYRCYVFSKSTRQSDTKTFTLSIQSKPYFRIPLLDQLVDKGSQLTWRCYATATPPGVYTWFKNGERLENVAGSMVVRGNTLLIQNLQEGHNGMYQCAVTNQYGTAFSSAQLRVLEFPPTFKKQSLPGSFYATLGGNSSIPCRPEAAPFPEFRWYHNGRDLGLTLGDTTSRVRLLPGGDLLITDVQRGDGGRYRCEAENSLGKDSVEGTVVILPSTTITLPPQPRTVVVNDTAFFFCRASYSPDLDMIYIWRFNGMPIDVEEDPYYSWGSNQDSGGLYVRNAQFEHEGEYTCVARTQSDEVTRSAYLTVNGPPGEVGGVYADRASVTTRGIRLLWIPGDDHGAPIQTYIIEGATNFEDYKVWRVIKDNIYPSSAVDTQDPDANRRFTVLTTLTPGTGYKFRVLAQNRFGLGTPSDPSSIYQTAGAPPTKVVEEVGGGGGKVADLAITWKPLEPVDHHGQGIGYRVYWRRKGSRLTDVDWQKQYITGNASRLVVNVGTQYYYTEYEVKVQAYNIFGPGPNSTIQVIYSAEDIPSGTPGTPWGDGFNSTCLRIYWKPVPDTRQQIKGKLLGYKINYWKTETQTESIARQGILHGQRDSGLIIGLDPDTFYSFTVQVYNTAGNGPKSDAFKQTTFNNPPLHYPTEVALHSVSEDTIEVRWRGVSTQPGEEPLQGYKIRYWVFGTDIRNASDVEVGRGDRGKVRGLRRNVLYSLRVLGYSRGGDGKMSMPPLLFSMENSQIRYDLTQTDLLAGSPQLLSSLLSLITALFITLWVC